MKMVSVVAALVVTTWTQTTSIAAETITYKDLVSRLTDLQRLAAPIVEGEKTFASTSHDRASRYNDKTSRYENWSANRDGSGSLRREGDAQVMVDLEGPGVLWRTWSAKADGGHIKIFIDGQAKPIVGRPIDCFDPQVTRTDEISLGTFDLKAGKHVLRATAIGAKEKARDGVARGSHIFALDYLRLKTSNESENDD